MVGRLICIIIFIKILKGLALAVSICFITDLNLLIINLKIISNSSFILAFRQNIDQGQCNYFIPLRLAFETVFLFLYFIFYLSSQFSNNSSQFLSTFDIQIFLGYTTLHFIDRLVCTKLKESAFEAILLLSSIC